MKAVISTGNKQYLVTEGDTLAVELLNITDKTPSFEALLIIDGDKTLLGSPTITGSKVTFAIDDVEQKADKVTSIRYKAKKRVRKVRGHRQRQARITITKITA